MADADPDADAREKPPADPDLANVAVAQKERAMDAAPVGIVISDASLPDNPLVYVNDAFERITGYALEEVVGTNCRFLQGPATDEEQVSRLREGIEAGEPITVELVNYRRDGEPFWNEITVAPIRDDDGVIEYYVGFQSDVTRRKRAERALAAERERLDAVFDRVDRLLDAVTTAVVSATERSELRERVCEALATVRPYDAAWIGTVDAVGEVIEVVARAGDPDGWPEGEVPIGGDHPAALALRENRVAGVPDETAPDVATFAGPATQTRSRASPTTVAVPLMHNEDTYGVLAVRVGTEAPFDRRETTVLRAVGRAVASALSLLETRRVLVADEVREVDLSVRDADLFFLAVTEAVGCRLEYEGTVADAERPAVFFTAYGASTEAVADAAADAPHVRSVTVVTESDDASLFEFELDEDALIGRLAAFGARTESIVAEDGRATVTCTVPAGTDLRALVERVQERYPTAQLAATRTRQRPPETREEYFARVEESLTDRQLAALQTAFLGGYFDRPRRATGDELADAMNVGRSTFHQHLRVAQHKLLSEFFRQ